MNQYLKIKLFNTDVEKMWNEFKEVIVKAASEELGLRKNVGINKLCTYEIETRRKWNCTLNNCQIPNPHLLEEYNRQRYKQSP